MYQTCTKAEMRSGIPISATKVFVLSGEITWELVGAAVANLYELNEDEETKQIVVPILSPGGDVDAAWSLYSTLKCLSVDVITIANGRVYSAAIIPYLAGSKRLSLPHSLFLFHPTTITTLHNEEKPMYKFKEELSGERHDRLIFKNVLGKLCNTAPKRVISKLAHDSKSFFIDAEKAKSYGLVTDIITNIDQLNF